jgi:hypothetical protein
MKNLEDTILTFENWSQPWNFRETILKSSELTDEESTIFDQLWDKVSGLEFWRDYDLVLSCKASHSFIRENYELSDEAIAKIVRALSYNYR